MPPVEIPESNSFEGFSFTLGGKHVLACGPETIGANRHVGGRAADVWGVFVRPHFRRRRGHHFFVLLALFPALACIVSFYGLFADRTSIGPVIDALKHYLPAGATTMLNSELHRLLLEKPAKLNIAFYGGLAVALWSASGALRHLSTD